MMKSTIPFLWTAVFPMLLAACAAASPTAPQATATLTPTPRPAAEATSTPTPLPTPTAVPTPTATPSLYDQYRVVAGQWTGSWTNTTFGSTGSASATLTLREDGTASFVIDLGGLVFGLLDPPAKTFSGTYDADGARFRAQGDDLFGDLTITVTSEGRITIQAVNIPVPGIQSMTAEGTITADEMRMTYSVTFAVGGSAEGVFNLVKE